MPCNFDYYNHSHQNFYGTKSGSGKKKIYLEDFIVIIYTSFVKINNLITYL